MKTSEDVINEIHEKSAEMFEKLCEQAGFEVSFSHVAYAVINHYSGLFEALVVSLLKERDW